MYKFGCNIVVDDHVVRSWRCKDMSDSSPRSSRTPSRSSTPLHRSPSRLVIPPVPIHTLSVPNFQLHGTMSASQSPHIQPATDLESSASSVINLDISDGILVADVDAEVETAASEETTAVGQIDDVADEESRKSLRDQLRRTLSKREPTGSSLSPSGSMSTSEHGSDHHSLKSSIVSVDNAITTAPG